MNGCGKAMKETGMVRRIDGLGRVVIPKEIRRTMKIWENAPLEIFIDDNQVIFKKYSAVLELESISQQVAEILYNQLDMPVLVCDTDRIIAVAGIPKKEIVKRPISHTFFQYLKTLEAYAYQDESEQHLCPIESDKRYVIACTPILTDGNVAGAIMFLSNNENSIKTATEVEINLTQAFASFISNQLPI